MEGDVGRLAGAATADVERNDGRERAVVGAALPSTSRYKVCKSGMLCFKRAAFSNGPGGPDDPLSCTFVGNGAMACSGPR